jgi:acylphosphatase
MGDEEQTGAAKRLHAIVEGRVQGVNFRSYTQAKALSLGLTGWVRNLPDGSVETVAEGDRSSLIDFLEFLNVGPPSAFVTHVDATWKEASNEFGSFRVRYF